MKGKTKMKQVKDLKTTILNLLATIPGSKSFSPKVIKVKDNHGLNQAFLYGTVTYSDKQIHDLPPVFLLVTASQPATEPLAPIQIKVQEHLWIDLAHDDECVFWRTLLGYKENMNADHYIYEGNSENEGFDYVHDLLKLTKGNVFIAYDPSDRILRERFFVDNPNRNYLTKLHKDAKLETSYEPAKENELMALTDLTGDNIDAALKNANLAFADTDDDTVINGKKAKRLLMAEIYGFIYRINQKMPTNQKHDPTAGEYDKLVSMFDRIYEQLKNNHGLHKGELKMQPVLQYEVMDNSDFRVLLSIDKNNHVYLDGIIKHYNNLRQYGNTLTEDFALPIKDKEMLAYFHHIALNHVNKEFYLGY